MGMTAIAAVLALSSTPLAAQETPSIATPPVDAPAVEPTPAPAADPLAPEPAAETSTPAETTATEAESADAAPAAKPVAKQAAKKAATKTVRTAERSTARASAPAAPAQPTASAEPVTEAPAAVPMAALEAPPEVVPAAPEPQQNAQLEEALPVAGGAGALMLALAGVGMAVRRRKRREEEELDLDRQAYAENTEAALQPIPVEDAAPEWNEPVIQPKAAPVVPANMQTTEVPEAFDTSNFGRHVKAAYGGPTPENPSLSLRKRLKLATELDRRERKLGTTPKPSAKPITASVPVNENSAFSFGKAATQAKWNEYQL